MHSEDEKCRCCIHPSTKNFVKLTTLANISGAEEKTYNELLQEITNSTNITNDETRIPHSICGKCLKQLKDSYIFVQQTRNAYKHYLREAPPASTLECKDEKDLNDYLDEALIEIPETKVTFEKDPQWEEIKIECTVVGESPPAIDLLNIPEKGVVNDHELKAELEDEGEDSFGVYILDGAREEAESPAEGDTYDEEEESLDEDQVLVEPVARRCDVCHKVYRDERALNIHKRFTHMPDEEKIPCPLCNYKTSRSSALKVHVGLIHGPEKVVELFTAVPAAGKKFPCNLCERGYQRREDLRKHFRKKHKNPKAVLQQRPKDKPAKPKDEQCFLCASCGQSYSSKKALDGHLLSHTGERPYACDLCDKAFKRIKDMKAHRVIHSDDKPFQCSNCGKSFKRADKLKIHMRVHSELRPYKCKECEKSFKYPSVLRTHMYMHTGQTPFACKTCGEAFSLRTSLNNHCLKNGHTK